MDTSESERRDEENKLSFINELPKVTPRGTLELVQWKGVWLRPLVLKAAMAMETQFKPLPSDIILASFPKTGTTWLKALTITILNFHNSKQTTSASEIDDQLLTQNPHQLVPLLEMDCFIGNNPKVDINKMTSFPRVFNTHLSYSVLPENIKNSGCKIVYITRNPMDTFVSGWHFFYQKHHPDVSIEEAFAHFCQGVIRAGPFFNHVLEYWRVCNERAGALFLTYEELKQEPHKHVKRLAEFLGCPLHPNEIEQVVWRCSYERLSKLAVNKDPSNVCWGGWNFSSYFRRGTVGDSVDYFTPDMVEQLRKVAMQHWEGSGLKFQSLDEILGSSH